MSAIWNRFNSKPPQDALLIMAGDLNALAPNDTCSRIGPQRLVQHLPPDTNPMESRRWAAITGHFLEMHQESDTRIGVKTVEDFKVSTATRLDRIYISWPAWAIAHFRVTNSLESWYPLPNNISDHIPVLSNIQVKVNIPQDSRPVPHWIAESATYAQHVQSMLNEAQIDIMSPEHRWRVHKDVLRLASRTATRVLMNGALIGLLVLRQAVLQSARAMITGSAILVNLSTNSFPHLCNSPA